MWDRVFFAVGMAFTLCLRVSDVAVLRWGWLGHKNWMVFFDYKVRRCVHSHTALLGEMAGVAERTPEAPPPRRRPGPAKGDRHAVEATTGDVQRNKVQSHRLAPMEADGGSVLPGARRIITGPYHMGPMANPETSNPIRGAPTSMENARPSAPSETHGKYRTFHQRLRMAVDASPRTMACGRICVGCRTKAGQIATHGAKLRDTHHTRGGGQRVGRRRHGR